MKKYFSKWLQTFSGSLKAVRVVLKRLPHSLRSFAMTDFLFSGSLKSSIETIPNEIPLQPVAVINNEVIRQRQQGEIK